MVFESHAGKNYIDELGFEVLERFFQAAALAVNMYFMFQLLVQLKKRTKPQVCKFMLFMFTSSFVFFFFFGFPLQIYDKFLLLWLPQILYLLHFLFTFSCDLEVHQSDSGLP